jgi:hypothetical protein
MTTLEELEDLRLRIAKLAIRFKAEPELVTLDVCPVYKTAVDDLQNAAIVLNRSLHNRHQALLKQSYKGMTAENAIKARIDALFACPPVPVRGASTEAAMTHEEVLKAIDETP